jgi:hypothetical protein
MRPQKPPVLVYAGLHHKVFNHSTNIHLLKQLLCHLSWKLEEGVYYAVFEYEGKKRKALFRVIITQNSVHMGKKYTFSIRLGPLHFGKQGLPRDTKASVGFALVSAQIFTASVTTARSISFRVISANSMRAKPITE